MLMALCAGHVLELRNGVQGGGSVWHPILQSMSQRISRNREIAGFHYPSDSTAGYSLAHQTFERLKTCNLFKQLVTEAVTEWPA
jgi:hypothetical protein